MTIFEGGTSMSNVHNLGRRSWSGSYEKRSLGPSFWRRR
eukprot:CAMPEP_0194190186 /NCGR_PEP_ID=MMETSP0154-20130528/62107_1 /TAXON_ID=1049557 /ORGANISM="Thalassiothrix antarctica, Strain L6-D1" /LENGTH=38 /DNA_ID= /DNA_START= /DNA_END= /DNA_ORIENTATION=